MNLQTAKKWLGVISSVIALILSLYMVLGMIHLVPLMSYQVFGETLLRFMTQIVIALLLIAAGAFWEV